MIDPLLRGTNRPLISVKWMDPISKYPKRNKWGTQPVALQQPAPLRPIWNTAAPTADQPNSPETRRARVLVGWSNKLLLPHNHKGRIAVASPAGRTSPFQIPRIRMAWIGRRRREREGGGGQPGGSMALYPPPPYNTTTSCFGSLSGEWSCLCNCPVRAESQPATESHLPKVATTADETLNKVL